MLNRNAMNMIAAAMANSPAIVTIVKSGASGSVSSSNDLLGFFQLMGQVKKKADVTTVNSSSSGVYFGQTAHDHSIDTVDFADINDLITCYGSGTTPVIERYDDHLDIVSSLTVTNSGSEPVTIREVYFLKFTNNVGGYLLDHTVLDSPVTLAVKEAKIITYTIRINL